MLNLSEADKKFIKENFDNAEELIQAENRKVVLRAIDDLIMLKGFISHEEGYNDFGRKAQRVYDNIYNNN